MILYKTSCNAVCLKLRPTTRGPRTLRSCATQNLPLHQARLHLLPCHWLVLQLLLQLRPGMGSIKRTLLRIEHKAHHAMQAAMVIRHMVISALPEQSILDALLSDSDTTAIEGTSGDGAQ